MMFVKSKDEALLKSVMEIMAESAQQTEEQRKKAADYLEKTAYAGMRLEEGYNEMTQKAPLRMKVAAAAKMKEQEAKKAQQQSDKTKKEEVELDFNNLLEYMLTPEFEQLDEISKETLKSYIPKAARSFGAAHDRETYGKAGYGVLSQVDTKTISKRTKGLTNAVKKMTKEEFDQLDEISKGTLGSYIKKATSSSDERSISNLSSRAADKLNNPVGDDSGEKDDHKSYLRSKGIARAVSRLTKEEVELEEAKEVELDEISHALMGRYVGALQRRDSDVQRDKTKSQDEKIRSQLDTDKKLTKTWSKMQAAYQKQRNSPEGIAQRQAKAAAAKAGQKSFNDLIKSLQKTRNESVELEEASIHPMGVHVIRHPGGKMQVHAVGSKVQGIEVGEHLHDNDLDDLADMGHKIKEVKPKAVKESRSLSSIISKMVATQQVEEGFEVRFDDGTDEFIEAGIYEAVKAAVQALDEEASQQVTEYAFGSLTNFMNIHKMVS